MKRGQKYRRKERNCAAVGQGESVPFSSRHREKTA